MTQEQFNAVSAKLNEMTPSLISEVVALYQQDPVLMARFGNDLTDLAQQGIISLREVLLGALEFNHPQLLGGELQWLEQLLNSRQLDLATLRKYLEYFRTRLSRDLPSESSVEVLHIFDQAVVHIKGL